MAPWMVVLFSATGHPHPSFLQAVTPRRHVPRPMPRRSPAPILRAHGGWAPAATASCGQELLPRAALSHSRACPYAAVAWHAALPGRPAEARPSPSFPTKYTSSRIFSVHIREMMKMDQGKRCSYLQVCHWSLILRSNSVSFRFNCVSFVTSRSMQ